MQRTFQVEIIHLHPQVIFLFFRKKGLQAKEAMDIARKKVIEFDNLKDCLNFYFQNKGYPNALNLKIESGFDMRRVVSSGGAEVADEETLKMINEFERFNDYAM